MQANTYDIFTVSGWCMFAKASYPLHIDQALSAFGGYNGGTRRSPWRSPGGAMGAKKRGPGLLGSFLDFSTPCQIDRVEMKLIAK